MTLELRKCQPRDFTRQIPCILIRIVIVFTRNVFVDVFLRTNVNVQYFSSNYELFIHQLVNLTLIFFLLL